MIIVEQGHAERLKHLPGHKTMTYYDHDRAILEAKEQYRFAAYKLAEVIGDKGSTDNAVELHKAVLSRMELYLVKLVKDFDAKY
jgi:hypothetical protein